MVSDLGLLFFSLATKALKFLNPRRAAILFNRSVCALADDEASLVAWIETFMALDKVVMVFLLKITRASFENGRMATWRIVPVPP